MDTEDKVLEYWNQRAVLKDSAGSDDLLAKQLEMEVLSRHVRSGMEVAEFGCGNAVTAIELMRRHDVRMHCYDFSPEMIRAAAAAAGAAGMDARVTFGVVDVRSGVDLEMAFDVVFSERMVINLPDWDAQAAAIRYCLRHVKPGGRYLMCENSAGGLARLNVLRQAAGLEIITPPWHNLYLDDEKVASLVLPGARLIEVVPYSATYYFLSRVVNAWLAKGEGRKPSYDAPVNRLALELPPFGDCAQGKLWIFERDRH